MKRLLFLFLLFGCAKPPIEPPPTPPIIEEAVEVHKSGKDSRGYWNAFIEFPDQPASIDSTTSFTSKVEVDLGEYCDIYKVSSFNGLDRGDIVEMDTFVYDETGRALYQRSKHKETLNDFDSFMAWWVYGYTRKLNIHMHAHVTDPDEPARAHWNVTVWCRGDGGVAPLDCEYEKKTWPECENTDGEWILDGEDCFCDCGSGAHFQEDRGCVPDNGGSTNYYTLRRAGVLPPDYKQNCDGATNMTLQLCTQRQALWHIGYTGPAHAVTHCRPHFPTIGLAANDIEAYVAAGKILVAETDHFITRLSMENETYPGRSVVNKNFYEPFQERLKAHLEEAEAHNVAAQTDPCSNNTAYDGLQGWCNRCY